MFKLTYVIGIAFAGIGIFFGFYFLDTAPIISLKIVTFSTVGFMGLFAFVRHVIFHKADTESLGWETERPDWMFEVGFANLAFGAMGLFAVFANFGVNACALVILGYAIYLLQAAMLHLYRYLTDSKKSPVRLWRSVFLTLLYVGIMTFFALNTLFKI